MDVNLLAAEFARRERSYLWDVTDPDAVAAWVLDGADGWEDVDGMAGAREALPAAERAFEDSADDYVTGRARAFGLVGGFAGRCGRTPSTM